MTRLRALMVNVALIACVAAAAITVGLLVTPMQTVSTAGQTLKVGVTAPSWSLSGPGVLDLFGQRIPTVTQFAGPVRPRIKLTHITLSQQLREFVSAGGPQHAADQFEAALVAGWKRYFFWQVTIVAAAAVLLLGGVAGWLRRDWRHSLRLIAVGLVAAEAVNLGAIMVTAYTAPARLRHVDSLAALVGQTPPLPAPPGPTLPTQPGRQRHVVVVGDSTAAGLGLPPPADPTPDDRSCHRSVDAYPVGLQHATGWHVVNLACSQATIPTGLLGPQYVGVQTLPAQLSYPAVQQADVIVVSVGADDVHWSDMLRACAVSVSCANKVEQAYFQDQLATFSRDYLQLLGELQLLPRHPQVVINLYYDPFTGDGGCLAKLGATQAKVDTMESDLTALNHVLSSGAAAASFRTAAPNFTGHGLCSALPYVQGVHDPAPFHPTAAGQLVIALADIDAITTTR